jgi:hypothetical protein
MAAFASNELIVSTKCDHVFHKRCCQDWLRQARTCPVCRTDIPESLGIVSGEHENENNNIGVVQNEGILFARGPFRSAEFQQDLLNLVSLLRERNGRR